MDNLMPCLIKLRYCAPLEFSSRLMVSLFLRKCFREDVTLCNYIFLIFALNILLGPSPLLHIVLKDACAVSRVMKT